MRVERDQIPTRLKVLVEHKDLRTKQSRENVCAQMLIHSMLAQGQQEFNAMKEKPETICLSPPWLYGKI
jgi:hypothetical protein